MKRSHHVRRLRRRGALLLPAAVLALLAGGCGSRTLETGYTPRPLNASDTERRAYYSGKYTKEAVQAEQEREAEFRARKPGVGVGS